MTADNRAKRRSVAACTVLRCCRLTSEALMLAGVLSHASIAQAPGPRLSASDRDRVAWLLEHRLPCLGCHELDGRGGAIGPDLTAVADRRTAAFISGMIADPQATRPGTRMPRVPMPEEWKALLTSYLVARKSTLAHPADPTPQTPATPLSSVTDGATLYQDVCAPCHGTTGRGDGLNAANLPTRPTAHADSVYMSTRSDDELFDGIFAGGYVLGESNRMPAWGSTLSAAQIRSLVAYIRQLCRCEQPTWAR